LPDNNTDGGALVQPQIDHFSILDATANIVDGAETTGKQGKISHDY